MLSAGVTLKISGTTATLTETYTSNVPISVQKLPSNAIDFNVNGTHWQTPASKTINAIVVKAYKGNDTIVIGAGVNIPVTVKGDRGNDTITAYGSGKLIVRGGDGNDVIQQFGSGQLYAYGDNGNDFIVGGSNNDYLYGGNGNDTLKGMSGNDYLNGDGGADALYGGWGYDRYVGGCHVSDWYYYQPGEDTLSLDNDWRTPDILITPDPTRVTPPWTIQSGTLTVDWSQQGAGACITATGPTTVNITWSGSTWTVEGVSRFVFYGSQYDDCVDMTLFAGTTELHGAGGNDTLKGGHANDVIFGNDGNDWLYGGPGSDQITGGDGLDQVWGGTENDFVYHLDGVFGDRFNDKNPGDFLEGDGSSISTVDQQYDPWGQWWLLRGTTVTVTSSTYVDPLGRVPAYVDIAGEARGLHFFASSLRVEVPSLSAFTIDTLTRNALLSAGFQIEVIVVAGGGGVDPLNC
ncbi:MAG: calcium-binding protein [Candidatus Peribacter sp.]|nr:calcium-binding protein [Candidatus Peribacter sp.]